MKRALNKVIGMYIDNDQVKLPRNTGKHVGIEIECFGEVTMNEVYTEILERDLERYVNVGDDGSIDTETYGDNTFEFRLLIPEDNLDGILKRFGLMFKQLELKVNRTCGLHVHLDCRARNASKVINRLVAAQHVLFAMVKRERWSNEYCQFRDFYNVNKKYTAINTLPLDEYKTVEVRLHHGTTNFREIGLWIKFLLTVVETKQMGKIKSKSEMLKWEPLKSNKVLSKYVATKFKAAWFEHGMATVKRRARLAVEQARRFPNEGMAEAS